jgi:hypothetical protein
MRKNVLTTAAVAAVLALSACAGDGTGPGGDGALTAAEAIQLNRTVLNVSAAVRGQQTVSRTTSPTGESTGSLNFTFDQTVACQPGGSVGLEGSMGLVWDDVARTAGMSADFAVAHDDCGHRLDSGDVITITGNPDIDVTLDATTGPNGLTSLVITESGAFTWAKDASNSGSCSLDVAAQLNPANGQVLVSGTFCGVDVSGTYSSGG